MTPSTRAASRHCRALLEPFAISVFAKLSALRTLELSASERARLREAVADDLKKCTNFCVPRVSVRAHRRASRLRIDLRGQGWHQQPRFDPGRRIFHWEHVHPVSALIAHCERQRTVRGVLRVLLTLPQVVWVLKEEDRRLTRLGYRSRRSDPAEAYERAGIVLLP